MLALTVGSAFIAVLTVIVAIVLFPSSSGVHDGLALDLIPLKVVPRASPSLDNDTAILPFEQTSHIASAHGFWRGLYTEGSLTDVTPGLFRTPESAMTPALRRDYSYDSSTSFTTGRFFEARARNLPSIRDLGRAIERPMCKYCPSGTSRNPDYTEWESITGQRYPLSDCREPIDVVFTWVNGSDPEHQKARSERTGEQMDGSDSGNTQRFRALGEIRYSIRSIFSYLPWVRHVFLLTFGHAPNWMDNSTKQLIGDEDAAAKIDFGAFSPKVTIVPHTHIFANPSNLPTFSSMSIETALHRIPGLSDNFIYLNDDMFFTRPLQQSNFFDHVRGPQLYHNGWERIHRCSTRCQHHMLGDGHCDPECLTSICSWDLGDCERNYASVPSEPAVYNAMLGVLARHVAKPNSSSATSDPPVDVVEGLFAPVTSSQLYASAGGEGVNAVLAAIANVTLAKRLALTDAAQVCAPGCARHWLGDGVCDDACDVAACEFDKSDCEVRFSELDAAAQTEARTKLLGKQEAVRRTFVDSTFEAVARLRFAVDAFASVTPEEWSASPAELRTLVTWRRDARGAKTPAPCVASQSCSHIFLSLADTPVTTIRSPDDPKLVDALRSPTTEAMRQWSLRSYHQRPFGFHHDFDHGFGVPAPSSAAEFKPRTLAETRSARAAAPVYSQSWSRKLHATGLDHEVPDEDGGYYRSYIKISAVRVMKAIGNIYMIETQHAHQTLSRQIFRYFHGLLPEEYADGEAQFLRTLGSMQLQTVVMSTMLNARHISIHTLAEAIFSSADFDCSGTLDRLEVTALLRRLVSGVDPDAPSENLNIEQHYQSPLFPFAVPLMSLRNDSETWNQDAVAETNYSCAADSAARADDISFVSRKLRYSASTSRHGDDFTARLTYKARTAVLQDGSPLASLCTEDCEILLRTQPWRLKKTFGCSDVQMTFDEFVSWSFARSVMQQIHLGNQLLFPVRISRERLDLVFLMDDDHTPIPTQMKRVNEVFTHPDRKPYACLNDNLTDGTMLSDEHLKLYQDTLGSIFPRPSPVEVN